MRTLGSKHFFVVRSTRVFSTTSLSFWSQLGSLRLSLKALGNGESLCLAGGVIDLTARLSPLPHRHMLPSGCS